MKEEKLYKASELVIGGSLNAVVFAYLNNCVLINNEQKEPFRFDYFPPDFDLSALHLPPKRTILQTRRGKKELGIVKADVYKHLLFNLSLSGLVPFSDKILSVKLGEENTIDVITERSLFTYQYDKLFIFDDCRVHNLPNGLDTINKKLYKVIDWINVRNCTTHPYDYFVNEGDFVNEVFFYPSDRVDGHHVNKKDIVSVSYLTEEQLQDYENSDTFATFKILGMMKELGIRGRRNGRNVLDKTKYKYYALKIESDKREIVSLEKTLYQDSENIEFMYDSVEDLIAMGEPNQESYLYKVSRQMS